MRVLRVGRAVLLVLLAGFALGECLVALRHVAVRMVLQGYAWTGHDERGRLGPIADHTRGAAARSRLPEGPWGRPGIDRDRAAESGGDRWCRSGMFLDRRKERREFFCFVESLKIKISGHEQLVMNLSGGNQQKVVLAKWLERNADIMIFDEPTRGIDVGTKYEIYVLMNRLLAEGKAIIMISSELPEVLGMSDRIIVMHEGRIKGEITDVPSSTQEEILSMAVA